MPRLTPPQPRQAARRRRPARTSGDDDPTDGVHATFDNLYPLNHVYYGYMDLFALQNLRNVELSVETALPGGAYLRDADFKLRSADFFYLQTLGGF